MPQPYLVPVSPSSSRRAHSRGVSSGRLTLYRRPLTVTEVIAILLSSLRQALVACTRRHCANITRPQACQSLWVLRHHLPGDLRVHQLLVARPPRDQAAREQDLLQVVVTLAAE